MGPLDPVRLSPEPRGSLGSLIPVPVKVGLLKPHEIALNVFSVGLNFRDVLNVLDMYPGDPGPPGGDCAGVVVQVGAASRLRVGQTVFGQAAGALGSLVVVDDSMVTPFSVGTTAEAAASIPTIFLTALACLDGAAKVRAGETVLIQAATGGLGLAAVQIAEEMGGFVVGTAGNPAKRAVLRSLPSPVRVVLDSRSTEFASETYCTLRKGVDVVLNSLTSPGMVAASLATVSLGGTFVEVAKRDIWSAARIAQERPDVCFSTVAVDFMPPSVIQRGLLDIAALLAKGRVQPPPLVNYSLGNAAQALRQLSSARHVGKILTSRTHSSRLTSSSTGGWAVVGGTGALGLMAARHLATIGVKECILMGRNVFSNSKDIAALAAELNIPLRIHMADAAHTEDLGVVGKGGGEEASQRPLDGVLHAGGVVRDATIASQTLGNIRAVMGPKVNGVENINAAAIFLPLQACNLFSSVAAALGSGGQVNYAAANAVLDSCAASNLEKVRVEMRITV